MIGHNEPSLGSAPKNLRARLSCWLTSTTIVIACLAAAGSPRVLAAELPLNSSLTEPPMAGPLPSPFADGSNGGPTNMSGPDGDLFQDDGGGEPDNYAPEQDSMTDDYGLDDGQGFNGPNVVDPLEGGPAGASEMNDQSAGGDEPMTSGDPGIMPGAAGPMTDGPLSSGLSDNNVPQDVPNAPEDISNGQAPGLFSNDALDESQNLGQKGGPYGGQSDGLPDFGPRPTLGAQ